MERARGEREVPSIACRQREVVNQGGRRDQPVDEAIARIKQILSE
jgi:hypothetical protein